MSALLGATLGVGLLLVASTWLWPRRSDAAPRAARRSVIADELALAGIPGVPVTAVIVVALVLAVVAAALAQAIFAVAVLTAVAGALGALVVGFAIRSRANRRRAANRAIWPDVVDHLVASVRAGMSLPDSIGALAELGPPSTRSAFAGFDDEFRRTGDFGSAVDSLKGRLADLNLFTSTLEVVVIGGVSAGGGYLLGTVIPHLLGY